MLVIDPARQRQRQAACGRALLAPTICAFPHARPGAGIYYTAYYFLQGEQELFASKGGETFKIALALALGIALVCSLPLPGGHEGKK